MNRTPLRVLLGAGLAVALTACDSVSSYAAKVDGDRISQGALEDELRHVGRNQKYVDAVAANPESGLQIRGAGRGTFDAAFTAQVLTVHIYQDLVQKELARRKITVTQADLEVARPLRIQRMGGEEVFNAFPKSYQDLLVRRDAEVDRLALALLDVNDQEASLRRAYEANKSDPQLQRSCVSHILVATKEKADEIVGRINGGEDFGAVARAESIDAGSAARNGELRCFSTATAPPDPAFQTALQQPVGQLQAPVQTSQGFHVIKVTSKGPAPFEEVRELLRDAAAFESQEAITTWLRDTAAKAKIDVNPKYGAFNPGAPGELPRVEPPRAPSTMGESPADGGPATLVRP